MPVKYVFVTGGVVSGLGKGITAASLGRLLKARGYKVTMQKFDPYINIDPGTMNPIQHGEVFVTDDGAETDLDLGHYERFIDESLTKNSNVTTGKVYWSVLQKERRGDFGGGRLEDKLAKRRDPRPVAVILKKRRRTIFGDHRARMTIFAGAGHQRRDPLGEALNPGGKNALQ